MRVLVVSAWEPWRISDGAVLPLHRHLHELASRHDITVIAAGSRTADEQQVDGPALTLPDGVHVRWFGTARPAGVDYAVRRLTAAVTREPAHVHYVERARLVDAVREQARQADVVHLAGWGTARLAAAVAPTPAVHYAVDPWHSSWHNRRLSGGRRLADVGERGLVRRHEHRWYPHAAAVVVVAQRDADLLAAEIPDARFATVPNGVDAGPEPLPPPDRPTLGFHGAFETQANVDGALALVREIWPRVQRLVPGVRVRLVGRDPTPEILALASPDLEVRGSVPDMRAELDRMSVHVTWMPSGLGMKNKVLEAMAAGRPVVANARGASGIGAGDGVIVAETPEEAAARIGELLTDRETWERAAGAGRARVLRDFTWAASAAAIERLWEQARDGVRR